jgi:hypothetical protein
MKQVWVNLAACSATRAAYRDHGYPGTEVDEGVAVGVDDDTAARVRDEHRQHSADAAGHRALAPGHQLT